MFFSSSIQHGYHQEHKKMTNAVKDVGREKNLFMALLVGELV